MNQSSPEKPKSRRGGKRPGAGRKPKHAKVLGAGASAEVPASTLPALATASAAPPAPADGPIGDPPEGLSDEAATAWNELAAAAAPGVLGRRHRPWLEMTACLLARLRGLEFDGTGAELLRLQSSLARLGLVPGAQA